MGIFSKKVEVEVCVSSADYNREDYPVSVTIRVPEEFPDGDLKAIVEQASSWCQKMSESLAKALWENVVGRENY